MTGLIRALLAAVLLVLAPAVAAKPKLASEADLKPDKAYLLVQVDPVEFQMMGTNRMITGVLFAPYDRDARRIGPGVMALKDPIAKDGKKRLYLIEIDPGAWVIAGTGGSDSQMGSANTRFSLGSYILDVVAGEVADLGVFVPQREESDNPDSKMSGGKLLGMAFFGSGPEPVPNRIAIRPRGDGDIAVPAWIEAHGTSKPAFVYGATFPNAQGGLINRIDGKDGRGRELGETIFLSQPGQPVLRKVPSLIEPPTPAPAPEPVSAAPPATPSSLP